MAQTKNEDLIAAEEALPQGAGSPHGALYDEEVSSSAQGRMRSIVTAAEQALLAWA